MTVNEAKNILGNRAVWELRQMIKALNTFGAINTPEENERLEACKVLLRHRETKGLLKATRRK